MSIIVKRLTNLVILNGTPCNLFAQSEDLFILIISKYFSEVSWLLFEKYRFFCIGKYNSLIQSFAVILINFQRQNVEDQSNFMEINLLNYLQSF